MDLYRPCIHTAAVTLTFGALMAFNLTNPAGAGQEENLTTTGPLDGMSFSGALGPDGQPKDVVDRFVFYDGTFVSKECELRCKYPARPYSVNRADGKVTFTSRTKCPYKDATIVWRGTVDGDTIEGVATWTIKRWYWTLEKRYEFSGKLEQSNPPLASAQ